jgi:hypothetical protein
MLHDLRWTDRNPTISGGSFVSKTNLIWDRSYELLEIRSYELVETRIHTNRNWSVWFGSSTLMTSGEKN